MKEIIFNLSNLAKIKISSNKDVENILDFEDIYSTIPNCFIDNSQTDIDAQIDIKFLYKNGKQGFHYNKKYSKFKIACYENNYYIPDLTFLMLCIFASKIQKYGYYLVHSSAMKINDKGVIFIGPSGSGKTNISLSMAKNYNAEFISGDMTLIKYDNNTRKSYLIGGTRKLTAFGNIIDSLYGDNSSKKLDSINGKRILNEDFLIKHNVKFSSNPCELKLIVNIRGGLKSYIKKDYDKPERLIKVVGIISEWIRTHSNYCVSTGDFFPDMDDKLNLKLRNCAVQSMSNIPQFSVYGPFDESAKIIYEQLSGINK